MTRVCLGDAAREIKQKAPAGQELPTVGLEHLGPGEVELVRWDEDAETTFTKAFSKGQVLFGRRRAYLRKAAVAPFDGVCSGDITVIAAKSNLSPRLLPFIIQNDALFEHAVTNSAGSLSPRVKWQSLSQFEFELPGIGKQEELADILWTAQETRSHYRQLLTTCDDVVKSQFVEMFENKGYELVSIGELAQSKMPPAKKTYQENDLIRYIDISSIDNGAHEVSGYTETPLGKAPSRAQQCIQKGDLLISTVRPNLKNVAINCIEADNVVASSGFCVLRCKGCPPEYMMAIVSGDRFTREMCRLTTGANYPAIKNADVLNYQVPLPPREAMNEFADFAASVDKSKFAVQKALDELNATTKKILNQELGLGDV